MQAAIRFLPNVFIGILLNLGTGLLVHRLHADRLVLVTSLLSAGSPLLMAIIDPEWSWWYCAFWAVLLGPLSADGEFQFGHYYSFASQSASQPPFPILMSICFPLTVVDSCFCLLMLFG